MDIVATAFEWITANIVLLGAAGSFLAFIIWDRKKNNLEIKALQKENLIYRPSGWEIVKSVGFLLVIWLLYSALPY